MQSAQQNNGTPPATILLAEDHLDSREALCALLEAFGFTVVPAVNGAEAVRLARQNTPDLILMDIMMPEVDGFEATRRLRDFPETRDVPIITLTAMEGSRGRRRRFSGQTHQLGSAPRQSQGLARPLKPSGPSVADRRTGMTETWEYGDTNTEEAAPTFPWPPGANSPILAAFGATWKAATFDPGEFFSKAPRSGGAGAAILYYLAIGILVAGTTLFWDSLSLVSGPAGGSPVANELGLQPLNPVVAFLLAPAFLMLGLGISTGVIHVLLLMLGGADHGFGTTVRVYCYASSPSIFGVVPILGTLIGAIWSVVLLVIGLREAHQSAAWKPLVAVILPFILLVTFLTLVFIAAMVALGGALPTG